MLDLDALAPGLAVPVARRLGIIFPDDIEARPEVGAAPALDADLVGQVGAGILGGVLHGGVDLEEEDDALRLKLGRDLADLGPERRQRVGRQLSRGVDDDGDRVDALRADRGQVEA